MAAASSSLKEYLKKYESSDVVEKKKKKKKPKKLEATGVLVVDEDPIWQKPVTIEEKVNDSEDDDKPQVDEDIEVKRMKRLEQVKVRRPFGAISEDGSGWIPVSNAPQIANLDDHDTDMSPPRKRRSRNDTPSPDPEVKPSSTEIADLSPPRQWLKRYHSPLPETENKLLDSDEHNVDMSPPRRRRARYDTPSSERDPKSSDLSPPRRQSRGPEPDLSPPRQVRRGSSNQGDLHSSPGPDLSPPRKSRRDLSPPRKNLRETTSLSDRPKTGLVTGKEVKDEIMKTKKDEYLRFKAMDPSVTGLGAEAVYRDKKTGKRLSKDEVLKSQQKEEKPKEVKLEWGKGLTQKREAEARQQELEREKEKPFARTRDDADLDRMLKDRVRWGDPMAHLVKRKKPELALPDIGDDEKMKASGFIIPQDVPNHSWLKRGLDAAPNRYAIKPGRHWDGVDRSTGFEKSMFKRMNEKQATEREAYLWSVADM